MNVQINIEQDILSQFSIQLKVKDGVHSLELDPSLGEGTIDMIIGKPSMIKPKRRKQLWKTIKQTSSITPK